MTTFSPPLEAVEFVERRSARKSRKLLRPISYLAFGGLIMICAPGVPGYISHGAPGAPGDVESPVDSGVAVLDDK